MQSRTYAFMRPRAVLLVALAAVLSLVTIHQASAADIQVLYREPVPATMPQFGSVPFPSNLYYDGRRQDHAFEKPVGDSADRRHHVRLWQVLQQPFEWIGG